MSGFPRYSLAGGNQYPALATTLPSQIPVIELVDGTGTTITNLGNGPADGTWTTMTLLAGTPDATHPPQYMKDSRGIVHCQGMVTPSSASQAIFTFPVGYRLIAGGQYFHYNTAPNSCLLDSNGVLTMFYAQLADLSVVHFPTVLL